MCTSVQPGIPCLPPCHRSWHGGAVRASDLQFIGRRFKSCLGTVVLWPGQATYICLLLLPSSVIWYRFTYIAREFWKTIYSLHMDGTGCKLLPVTCHRDQCWQHIWIVWVIYQWDHCQYCIHKLLLIILLKRSTYSGSYGLDDISSFVKDMTDLIDDKQETGTQETTGDSEMVTTCLCHCSVAVKNYSFINHLIEN